MYVKDELSSSEVKELNESKTETVWVRVLGCFTELLIEVCYKSSNAQVEEVEKFKVLEKAAEKHVIIMGDFN